MKQHRRDQEETLSDHRYIEFKLDTGGDEEDGGGHAPAWRWNPRKLDLDKVKEFFGREETHEVPAETPELLVSMLEHACEAAAKGSPPGGSGGRRRPMYWWTEEIAEARRQCVKLHRLAYRRRALPEEAAEADREYKAKKKELQKLIARSKERCWRNLCKEVERDPYGQAYKIVRR